VRGLLCSGPDDDVTLISRFLLLLGKVHYVRISTDSDKLTLFPDFILDWFSSWWKDWNPVLVFTTILEANFLRVSLDDVPSSEWYSSTSIELVFVIFSFHALLNNFCFLHLIELFGFCFYAPLYLRRYKRNMSSWRVGQHIFFCVSQRRRKYLEARHVAEWALSKDMRLNFSDQSVKTDWNEMSKTVTTRRSGVAE